VETAKISLTDVSRFIDATLDYALDMFAYLPVLHKNDTGADFFTLAKVCETLPFVRRAILLDLTSAFVVVLAA
jgi:hypothetical protein